MRWLESLNRLMEGDRPLSAVSGEALEISSLEGRRRARARVVSLAVHFLALIALVFLGNPLPLPPEPPRNPQIPRLVFLIQPGPGGGGGGGGERSTEPPSVQKKEGRDRARLAVEVERPAAPAEKIAKEEKPVEEEEKLKAPVVAQSPDEKEQKGILEGPEQAVASAGSGEGAGAGSGAGAGIGPGRGPGLGPGWGGGFGGGAYRMGSGVVPPVLRRQVRPNYTDHALAKKIQGSVTLEIIILRDGTVGDVRVVKSLDSELDRKAVEAVRQWLFAPGRLQGQAVDVLAEVQVAFTLL